uniref:U-box domain-containing protein 12 n=1 Tax=Anthurium amnicola TaxID=1678845 RepID=A0A1D1XJ32_9ARAE
MATCDRDAVGFRLWPLFSAAAFRRKLVDALMCGVSHHRRKEMRAPPAPPPVEPSRRRAGSERLSELLKAEVSESGSEEAEAEGRKKVEALEELMGVVKRLQQPSGDAASGEGVRRREAAEGVRRLAKEDPEARETLAMLGAIPPLVGMLDSDDVGLQAAALYALLNLGVGNDMNKAAIVAAGAVHKMVNLMAAGSPLPPVSEAIVANFLGLSALDANKPIIGSSGGIPFLVQAFRDTAAEAASRVQARQDALRALLNLSIAPANVSHLVDAGLVPDLLASVGDMEVTERALSVLSNVVATAEGRRAVSRAREAFQILVDVLNWADSPGCQEKATYVLMVMAHKAYSDRAAMVEAGIVSSLLELTLLGTALAQKRASRILECLRVDKGKQVAKGGGSGGAGAPAVSAPLYWVGPEGRGAELDDDEDDAGMSEERKAVKRLVQQSLQHNMRRIARRANLPQDFAPSDHFMALAGTSTSKSLPF